MNHPGFGRSDGPAELRKMAPAALGVYDAICQIAGDRPVYIDADSMGCTQALYTAAERQGSRPVAGLVLKNPPPLRQLVMGRFGWWNLWLAAGPIAAGVPKELDAVASARRVKAPAIFIRAMNDTLVPPGYQQKIIDAYAGEKVMVDFRDAEHNTPLDEPVELEVGLALRKMAAGIEPEAELEGPGLERRGRMP
jgi:pimeloyl-ACP methyl ester carboxylesterase